jgi:hypothetical protein
MKIYTAVVANVTDDCSKNVVTVTKVSSHTTKREAKKAVLRQFCLLLADFGAIFEMEDFDEFFDLATILGEEVTPSRKERLRQWLKRSRIYDYETEQDDVPTDKDELKTFQDVEGPIVKRLASIFDSKFRDDDEMQFSKAFEDSTADFDLPPLPEGENVFEPTVYKIVEQELVIGDAKGKRKLRR